MKGYSVSKLMKILAKTGGRCAYCGEGATVVDHFLPKKKGGKDHLDNLMPSCVTCNSIKLAHDLETFRVMLHFKNIGLRRMPLAYHDRLYELGVPRPEVVFFYETLPRELALDKQLIL